MEEWQSRPSKEFAAVRRATAGEARRLKYDPDVTCREASGFVDDDHSLSGSLLEKAGILSPIQHWWDRPYRIENGTVVYPGKQP